jgi:uncharacterized protein involved in propanediol utilization
MPILSQIASVAASNSTSDRGAVKRFIIATLSYAKHNNLKLTNKQIAELTRSNIPNSKTSAGSVADYITNLNCGLFDYLTLEAAISTLSTFNQPQPTTPIEPIAFIGPLQPKPARKSRAKQS